MMKKGILVVLLACVLMIAGCTTIELPEGQADWVEENQQISITTGLLKKYVQVAYKDQIEYCFFVGECEGYITAEEFCQSRFYDRVASMEEITLVNAFLNENGEGREEIIFYCVTHRRVIPRRFELVEFPEHDFSITSDEITLSMYQDCVMLFTCPRELDPDTYCYMHGGMRMALIEELHIAMFPIGVEPSFFCVKPLSVDR